jgi:nitrogen-specific signal transduction histidine kinase
MSTQVTIKLTDDVYHKADRFARLANRDLASVLADTIKSSISHISAAATILAPISSLSDPDVLALTALQMEPAEDIRLSELLDLQQAGILTDGDRSELQLLIQTYDDIFNFFITNLLPV